MESGNRTEALMDGGDSTRAPSASLSSSGQKTARFLGDVELEEGPDFSHHEGEVGSIRHRGSSAGRSSRRSSVAAIGGFVRRNTLGLVAPMEATEEESDEIVLVPQVRLQGRRSTIQMTAAAQTEERPQWGNKLEFILTTVGYAVGLGNVWRFPYLCYQNGGGAFLVPYTLCLFALGIPLFCLELGVGQIFQVGSIAAWPRIHPRLAGVGVAGTILTLVLSLYYNVIICWTLYYMAVTFTACPLPWTTGGLNFSDSAAKYWLEDVLHKSESMNTMGSLNMGLWWTLLLAWIGIYFCVFKGISSAGKVVYFTAPFPYLVLSILFIQGVMLEGAWDGVKYFLVPDWSKLLELKVWYAAANQIFYSLGPGWGSLVTFASFNKRTNNFVYDSLTVPLINCGTSVFAGLVVFSVIGHLSHVTGKAVEEVASSGSGLAFVVYPAALGLLPGAPFFALLFFIMLLCLGVDSEFACVETVMTALVDGGVVKNMKKEKLAFIVCFLSWLFGWIFITESGPYWVELFDTFAGGAALFAVALVECVAIAWVYGIDRFMNEAHEFTGTKIPRVFKYMVKYVIPVLLSILLVLTFVTMAEGYGESKPEPGTGTCSSNGEMTDGKCRCEAGWRGDNCDTFTTTLGFPPWAIAFGFILSMVPLFAIFIGCCWCGGRKKGTHTPNAGLPKEECYTEESAVPQPE